MACGVREDLKSWLDDSRHLEQRIGVRLLRSSTFGLRGGSKDGGLTSSLEVQKGCEAGRARGAKALRHQ